VHVYLFNDIVDTKNDNIDDSDYESNNDNGEMMIMKTMIVVNDDDIMMRNGR